MARTLLSYCGDDLFSTPTYPLPRHCIANTEPFAWYHITLAGLPRRTVLLLVNVNPYVCDYNPGNIFPPSTLSRLIPVTGQDVYKSWANQNPRGNLLIQMQDQVRDANMCALYGRRSYSLQVTYMTELPGDLATLLRSNTQTYSNYLNSHHAQNIYIYMYIYVRPLND